MNDPRQFENLMKNRLGPNDTFRFRCKQCGACCKNREDIILSPYDLYRIAWHFETTPQKIIERYCRCYIGNSSRMPVILLKATGQDRACPFLERNRCAIHYSKPTVCALFPLGRAASLSDEDTNSIAIPAETIYFLQDVPCGGRDESHIVREWLKGFDIKMDDPWFGAWQRTITKLHTLLMRLEKIAPPKAMDTVQSVVLMALYLDYDVQSVFLPQFTARSEKLMATLQDLLDHTGYMLGQ